MEEKPTQSKKITVGLTMSWVFGSLFALTGFVSLFSEPVPGLVMLIMAAVLLPPVTKLIDKKYGFHLSKGMKTIIIIIGLIVSGATVDTSDVSSAQQPEMQEREQTIDNKNIAEETTLNDQEDEVQSNNETTKQVTSEEKSESLHTPEDQEKIEIPKETKTTPMATETVSQKNAVRSAKSYLDYSAFSYTGLIKQLEYEQFSHDDAVYGVDNSGADWFEQASKSAESYMEYSAFSRGGLIEQLKYEGFTQEQAEYGADAVGL